MKWSGKIIIGTDCPRISEREPFIPKRLFQVGFV